MDDVPNDVVAVDPDDGVGRQPPADRPRSGHEIEEITEEVERLPLETSVDTVMGPFEKGTQAPLAQVIGKVADGSGSSSTTSPHPPLLCAGLAAAGSGCG